MYTENTRDFRNLLNTSKGRDKFCQLLQYTANFYVTNMRHSLEYASLVKEKKIESVVRAKTFESSISNGRKIFRLLLFLNEVKEIEDLLKNTKMWLPLRVMKIISASCSFIYYLTDNIVWFSNMNFMSKTIPGFGYRWKQIKNMFSLTKTVLEIIISAVTVKVKKHEENRLRRKLEKYDSLIVSPADAECYDLTTKLILIRREARFHMVEVLIYMLRLIMLVSSLKLVGHDFLHPIFVSSCGLGQSGCTVFKSMMSKRPFYKLTIEEVNTKLNRSPTTTKGAVATKPRS